MNGTAVISHGDKLIELRNQCQIWEAKLAYYSWKKNRRMKAICIAMAENYKLELLYLAMLLLLPKEVTMRDKVLTGRAVYSNCLSFNEE